MEKSIHRSDYGFRNSSGSLAIFAAIRRLTGQRPRVVTCTDALRFDAANKQKAAPTQRPLS
jgi:hypothetical protein